MSPDQPRSLPGWGNSRLGRDGAEAAATRTVPRPPGLLVWTFKAETVTTGRLATQLPRACSSGPAAVTSIQVSAQFASHSHPAPASRGALPQWSLRSQAPSVYRRTRVHTGQARPRAQRTTVTPGGARPCAPAPPPAAPPPPAPPALCRTPPAPPPPASSTQFLCDDVVMVLLTLACCV